MLSMGHTLTNSSPALAQFQCLDCSAQLNHFSNLISCIAFCLHDQALKAHCSWPVVTRYSRKFCSFIPNSGPEITLNFSYMALGPLQAQLRNSFTRYKPHSLIPPTANFSVFCSVKPLFCNMFTLTVTYYIWYICSVHDRPLQLFM